MIELGLLATDIRGIDGPSEEATTFPSLTPHSFDKALDFRRIMISCVSYGGQDLSCMHCQSEWNVPSATTEQLGRTSPT